MIKMNLGCTVKFRFVEEDGRWYVDYPEYPGPKANLEMVLGADHLLWDLAGDKTDITLNIKLGSTKAAEKIHRSHKDTYGRWYTRDSGQEL